MLIKIIERQSTYIVFAGFVGRGPVPAWRFECQGAKRNDGQSLRTTLPKRTHRFLYLSKPHAVVQVRLVRPSYPTASQYVVALHPGLMVIQPHRC